MRLTLAAAVLIAAHFCAHAQTDRSRTDQVEVRLLSETATVSPGQTIHLGLEQKIIPHWHTYWKNPGDSGTATSIDWTLPPGVTVGGILWPAPSSFAIGPITNYGYADQVILLTRLTIPASQAIGSQVPVTAKASWLVCEETCIPQDATLKLTLNVAAQAGAGGADKQRIDAALQRIPQAVTWPARYERNGAGLTARLDLPAAIETGQHALAFYAAEWGTIAHNAKQAFTRKDGQLAIALAPGDAAPAAGAPVRGVLVLQDKSGAIAQSYELGADAPPPPPAPTEEELTFWHALLLAFAGGIVLNLMPCVFPVLSIKALSLFKYSDLSAAQKRLQGVAYTAGVLASFSLLALALVVMKQLGTQIGWGFQFQSPYFVLGVAYLIFVVGLSLSGVFALGGPANLGATLADKQGYSGSFFTGVLATIVATPCTAPFMGAALGFAVTQPSMVLWLIFLALGFGLALPYLLISAWPALHALLPKPGAWMERFKQALAFPMYGAAVWLVWVLAQQASVHAVPLALGGMLALALIAWIYDSTRHAGKRVLVNCLLVAGVIGTAGASFQMLSGIAGQPAIQAYSPSALSALRAEGKPVFINLTAAWCITCLVNERVALDRPAFRELIKKEGITYLKGDWTNQDPQISALLKQYGRSGVPLYLFYPAGVGSKAVILPQILTHDIVRSALQSS